MSGYRSVFRLEQRYVQYLPTSSGLLVLWRDERPVSLRHTANIRRAAEQHARGERTPTSPDVTHFSYEMAQRPGKRVVEIEEHLRSAGYRLPP